MPQHSTATVADWLSAAKVNQLTEAALEALLARSFSDIQDLGAIHPICLDDVQCAIRILAFEPSTGTQNSKFGSTFRLSLDQVDASMSGHTRVPCLVQFGHLYRFREAGD